MCLRYSGIVYIIIIIIILGVLGFIGDRETYIIVFLKIKFFICWLLRNINSVTI